MVAARARRSVADRVLRKDEAPGSNPGESMNERSFTERVNGEPGFESLEVAARAVSARREAPRCERGTK